MGKGIVYGKSHKDYFLRLVAIGLGILLLCGKKTSNIQAAEDWNGAVGISVNTSVTGNVTSGNRDEQDRYCFELNQNGVVEIQFYNKLQGSTDGYWHVYLVNGLYETIDDKVIYGNREITTLTKMGLAAGKYYVKIQSCAYGSASSKDIYTFQVNYTASENWEHEFNEDFSSATKISVNTDYYGSTRYGNRDEEDYYTFTLDTDGNISLQISYPLQALNEKYWYVYLYDGAYSKVSDWDLYGAYTSNSLTRIGLSAGTYYIRIESAGYSDAKSTDVYKLNVNYMSSNFWEKEQNESFVAATNILTENVYNGTLDAGYRDEQDYYSFDIAAPGVYHITIFTDDQSDTSNYWNVKVYNSVYSELSNIDISGNSTETPLSLVMDAGRYYIKVCSCSYYEASSSPYGIMVSEYHSVSDVTVSGYKKSYIYSGKNIMPEPVITYNGVPLTKNIDYSISYSSNLNVGIAIIYIKGIGNFGDSTFVTFKIVPKGTTLTKLSRSKKAFTVKWKKNTKQISGYQIQYSTSKTMKSAKRLTIQGSGITKKVVKNLKKKKKYYVRVRTYKTTNGSKFYSAWSNVMSVKTK